jgi:hypothetical protein
MAGWLAQSSARQVAENAGFRSQDENVGCANPAGRNHLNDYWRSLFLSRKKGLNAARALGLTGKGIWEIL